MTYQEALAKLQAKEARALELRKSYTKEMQEYPKEGRRTAAFIRLREQEEYWRGQETAFSQSVFVLEQAMGLFEGVTR